MRWDESPTSKIGLLRQAEALGYNRAVWRIELPHGFEAGRTALQQWASQSAANINVEPACAAIAVGQTVALAIPVLFSSISATCRIIETVDEPTRFGFTYATLPHHPEDGEESFIVERKHDGSASYTITAVWRAGMLCTRIVPPLTRWLQVRATRRYLAGVAEWQP